jgi:hypothetical protein
LNIFSAEEKNYLSLSEERERSIAKNNNNNLKMHTRMML